MREEMDSSASAICSFFDSRVSAMWKASSASAIFAHEPSSARLLCLSQAAMVLSRSLSEARRHASTKAARSTAARSS